MILGLPGETEDDMLATVRYVCGQQAKPFGIKLQLLHVLRGTDLCGDYEAGSFEVLSQDEYIELVIKCLEVIPEDIVIHRVTGDGPKNILVAPLWSGNKRQVLNTLHQKMKIEKREQGTWAKQKKFCPFFLVFMRAPANVPNLRFTKSIQPWYSQLVVENRCSGVVRSQSKK